MRSGSETVLRSFLVYGPCAWAVVRAVECDLLADVDFKVPVLEIGCGDGEFARVLQQVGRKGKFDLGVDISRREVERARKSGAYKKVKVGDVRKLSLRNGQMRTVFSNGALEHVAGIDAALREISRVLRRGGRLVFTAPSSYFSSYLFFSRVFAFLGWKGGMMWYASLINGVFVHRNLFDYEEWKRKLERHNLDIVEYCYYNPAKQVAWCDVLTYLAIPADLSKWIFGKWVIWKGWRQLVVGAEMKFIRLFYTTLTSKKEGGSILVVAKKR